MTAERSDTSKGNINGMFLEVDARTSYYIKHRLKTHNGFFLPGVFWYFWIRV